MATIKERLLNILPKKKVVKPTFVETPSEPVKKPQTKKKPSNIKVAPATTAPAKPLSPEERAEKLAKSAGLDVRIMTSEDAFYQSKEAERVHVNHYYIHQEDPYIKPTIDDLYLIRSTDIFPENSIIKPVSHGLRFGSYTDVYFINRIITQNMSKLGITQKDGKPVTCEADFYNVELSEEMIAYANNLDLGPEHDQDKDNIPPERKLFIHSKHIAENSFSLPFKTVRESLHFTMNTLVSSHSEGSWDGNPFIFIEPYKPHNGDFRSIGGFDSWTMGNLSLQSPTLLIRPETLEQIIEVAKKNPEVKNTLKNCKIVIMTPTEKISDAHYVNAILHEQGAPAYICKDQYVLATTRTSTVSTEQIEGRGLETALYEIATELSNNGTPTLSNILHSNTTESSEEVKAADCEAYTSILKFARFLADKINHKELSEKIKPLEALDSEEKLEDYYSSVIVDSARKKYEKAYETDDPKADEYYFTFETLNKNLKSTSEHRVRESLIKNVMYQLVMKYCSPILNQMSNDKVSRLLQEFKEELTRELESKYSKPVKFDVVTTKTPEKGEEE